MKTNTKTLKHERATIERQGAYARLRWEYGGKPTYLGKVPTNSPTPLLDLALTCAPKLNVFALQKLIAANKSFRGN